MAIPFSLRTPRVIMALILREMSTTYGRSAGGYFWVVAEPVFGIVLLTAMFSLMMRAPPLGTSFALFYGSGVVPFLAYMSTQQKIATAVQFSRGLLVYPRVTFLDAALARFVLNGVTQILVAYLILSALLLTQDTRAVVDFGIVSQAMALTLFLGFGVGALNCVLFSILPTYQRIWAILNRPMFIVSGIFFTYDAMPPFAQDILWWNPLIHIVGLMRRGLYPTYAGDYISVNYVLFFAAIPAVLGVFFLRRYHKKILNEL
ncbi:MAG: ABC transporter permease [Qingshengfaniella sp.]